MSGRIRYHPLFDCDVREAAGWYDRRSAGLGDAFVDVVRATVDDVITDQSRFARFAPGTQFTRVPRFPYVVLFSPLSAVYAGHRTYKRACIFYISTVAVQHHSRGFSHN